MIALWFGLSFAQGPHTSQLIETLGGLGQVNWTTMEVTASGSARQRTTEGIGGVEANAERAASSALRIAIERVAVQDDTTVSDLLEDDTVGEQIATRLLRRRISKVTYGQEQEVKLELTLRLSDLLKPWTWERVREPTQEEHPPRYTGLVVDARGRGGSPVWAPRIVASDGQEFYGGELSAKAIRRVTPAVYVQHGSAPAAQRAGPNPLFVEAQRARDGKFYLDERGSELFRSDGGLRDRLGEGHLVIVMTP